MDNIVLLGAGASFGSGDVVPHPPPLGNRLFEKMAEVSPFMAAIPKSLQLKFKDFEAGMAEFRVYSGENVQQFQREMAKYLASFKPGRKNEYIRLIRELGVGRVIYASLNYDLLLEQAAAIAGCEWIQYGPVRGPEKGSMRLLKMHGSSNFWPDLRGLQLRNVQMAGLGVDIQTDIKILSRDETLRKCETDCISPAMCMYAIGKAVKVSPDFIRTQQAGWESSAASAASIFVIGVRVHMVDAHIWGVLARATANVYYFGVTETDREEFDNWKHEFKKENAFFLMATFSESIILIKDLIERNIQSETRPNYCARFGATDIIWKQKDR